MHGPSVRLAVLAVATSVPPEGESQWSHALIAGHLRERGLVISAATVGRVLAEAKVRPTRSAAGSTAPMTPPSGSAPGLCATCTPRHASWLNMAEQWFGVLTRRLLRRGEFASRDDLDAKITAFTIQHHKNARPYSWSYDAGA